MPKRYYITTPIYYVNSVPHIGTALTTLAADVIARFQRMKGRDVHFLTGTDENAIKVAEAAEKAGKTPQMFVDEVSEEFRRIWGGLDLSYDDFIRTTEERHKRVAQEVFSRLQKAGYIYADKYSGWYDVSSETFYKEAELVDGKSPEGNEVRWVEEENYFFKLSAFEDRLKEHIETNPEFILPEARRNEVLSFTRQGLRDACITRSNAGWGIPVPGDDSKVIYVWFEALTNYISAIGWPDGDWQSYWPADVELMGKDILVRFHGTLWPAMLMGLDLPLPKTLLGHAWVLVGQEKMSKSRGESVRPLDLAANLAERTGCGEKEAVDAVRYYMARTMPLETDYTFSHDDFDLKYNTELVNDLSNGVHRVVSMLHNFCGGRIPGGALDPAAVARVGAQKGAFEHAIGEFRVPDAIENLLAVVAGLNMDIDTQKPWESRKSGDMDRLNNTMRSLAWQVRAIEGLCRSVMPTVADRIAALLALPAQSAWDEVGTEALPTDHLVGEAVGIFQRLEKKEVQETEEKPVEDYITIDDFMKVKLRIARILEAERVQDSDKLVRLELIVGEERRQVLAGIAEQYSPEDLIGRQVVLVANLKPRKMRGLESQGMILAADAPDGGAILLMPDKEAPEGASVH